MSDFSPSAMGAMVPPDSPMERLRGLSGQPLVRKALPWLIGTAAIGVVALTWSMLAPAPQRILYSELDDGERAGVVSSLDKAGIAYTIDNQTGTLTVGQDDLYKARMLVAADGKLASPDATTALDNLPLGASRTMEGEHLRAAREHELMLTIQEIDGVESARVHLAEVSKSVFVRDDAPPTASVMVRMAKGRQLADSQVTAVVNLIAGSVPGMSADAVRVVDQRGRLLSQGGSPDADRLDLQGRMEDKLRAQLDTLLSPVLGQGNFTSEIQVELDMDQVTSARESYDKNGVVRSETQAQSLASSTQPGQAGGIPGALSNTPPPATVARPGAPQGGPPSPSPTASAAPVNGESSATRTYELGREVSVANSAPGKIKRLSVAVAISQEAMKKAAGRRCRSSRTRSTRGTRRAIRNQSDAPAALPPRSLPPGRIRCPGQWCRSGRARAGLLRPIRAAANRCAGGRSGGRQPAAQCRADRGAGSDYRLAAGDRRR